MPNTFEAKGGGRDDPHHEQQDEQDHDRRLCRRCFLLRLRRFSYCHSVRAGRHYYGVHYYLRPAAGRRTGRLRIYAIGTDNRMTR